MQGTVGQLFGELFYIIQKLGAKRMNGEHRGTKRGAYLIETLFDR